MSNSSDSRRTAPSPVPAIPAVEWPSSSDGRQIDDARAPVDGEDLELARPRRASTATVSRRPGACFTRLVASSVATRPARCASVSSEARSVSARSRAANRAADGWLDSVTGIDTWAAHFHRVITTRVPCAGRRREIANSFDSRFAPERPSPRPPPVRIAVLHRLRDVCNAGAVVLERQPQPAPRAVVDRLDAAPSRRRRAESCCAPARWRPSRSSSDRRG